MSSPALPKLGSEKSHGMANSGRRRKRRATTTNSKCNPSSAKAFFNYIDHLLLDVPSWARLCFRKFLFLYVPFVLFSVFCARHQRKCISIAVRTISIIKIKRKFIAHFTVVHCFPSVLYRRINMNMYFCRVALAPPFYLDPFHPYALCYRFGFIPIHISWKMVIIMQMKGNRRALASAWRLPLTFLWFQGRSNNSPIDFDCDPHRMDQFARSIVQ